MGLYEKYVLPRLLDLTMRNPVVRRERERFVPLAAGRVLEIGIGSGLNIPFYSERVDALCGLDPSPELGRMARKRAGGAPFPIEFVELSSEAISMADESFDTVVTTWTLCTIPDPLRALREMRRVLKADGRLIFVEHGRAPESSVQKWQDRLTPAWRCIGGGCHLNRKIDDLIRAAGFDIAEIETGYVRGPRFSSFLYRGVAERN
jgi:ubiquinone/menaquinone biosynthesis C-methylase UbiE